MTVGLSQRVLWHNKNAYDCTEQSWYSLFAANTIKVIPNDPKLDITKLAEEIDVFVLTGGDDSTKRRIVEISLASKMMKLGKPVIGVCHGYFLLSDLFGCEVIEEVGHYGSDHSIICEDKSTIVNSFHSLVVKELIANMVVLATDVDNNIESWISGNVAGMAWHPERMKEPFIPNHIKKLLRM